MTLNTVVTTKYGKGVVRHITPAGNLVVVLYVSAFIKGDYTHRLVVRAK